MSRIYDPLNAPVVPNAPQGKVWNGAEGVSVLIVNTDAANTIYAGYRNNIQIGGPNTIPIGPGQSVVIDGSNPIYVVGAAGTANVSVIPGGSSFFRPTTLASLGGISVFILPLAPTGAIPVNSIWLQTSGGVVVGFFTWNGAAWVQQQFNASDVIAVGTIIASLIAAGTVVAGIVDATTITGASFIGTGSGKEFALYNGVPAADNLVLTSTSVAYTDSHGNDVPKGTTVYFGTGPFTAINIGSVSPSVVWLFGATHQNTWVQGTSINAFNNAGNQSVNVNTVWELIIGGTNAMFFEVANGFAFAFVDTPHSLGALAAGSGYTVNQGRFWFTVENEIAVDIVLTAGAATVAGVYAFANSLTSGPVNQRSYPLGYNGTYQAAGTNFPAVRISPAGTVSVQVPAFPNGTVLTARLNVPLN